MKNLKALLFTALFLITTFASAAAFAGGYIRVGGVYFSEEAGEEGATGKMARTLLDFGGGYIFPSGLTIGGLYGTDKKSSDDTTINRTAMGPTVGWISTYAFGPYILATYFLQAEKDVGYKGKGYQVDFGYRFNLGKVAFAPQLTYRDLSFDEVNGTKLSAKVIEKKIDPYFMLFVEF